MASQSPGMCTTMIDWRCLTAFSAILSVSSAIVQRYLPHILEAALGVQPRIQSAAVDIMSFTIKQGLAHPLQVRGSGIRPQDSSHPLHHYLVPACHCCIRNKQRSPVECEGL